jgi:hypothetical protein
MELGQYEIKRVELAVAVPENDKDSGQQRNGSSTAREPKIRPARKKPQGPLRGGMTFHRDFL